MIRLDINRLEPLNELKKWGMEDFDEADPMLEQEKEEEPDNTEGA